MEDYLRLRRRPTLQPGLGNPLEALFKIYLANEIRNICGGRIAALRTRQKTGTLSIGYGDDVRSLPRQNPCPYTER